MDQGESIFGVKEEEASGSRTHAVLLPGMDGTGVLFGGLVQAMGDGAPHTIVSYPAGEVIPWSGYLDIAREALPTDRPFTLIAESFSGPIAIALAAERPSGLQALVLCCTYPHRPLPRSWRWLTRCARPFLFRGGVPQWALRRFLLGADAPEELLSSTRAAVAQVSADVFADRVRSVGRIDVRDRLPEIIAPTLLLTAMQDRVVSARSLAELQEGIPHAEHVALPGPHLLLQRHPQEAWSAIAAMLNA